MRVQTITELMTVKSADTYGCTFSARINRTNLLINTDMERKARFERIRDLRLYKKRSIF